MSATLEITYGDTSFQLELEEIPTFPVVQSLVQKVWRGPGLAVAKYMDEDGNLSTFAEATFKVFLRTAKPSFEESGVQGKPCLKLVLPAESCEGWLLLPWPAEAEAHAEEGISRHIHAWIQSEKDAFEPSAESSRSPAEGQHSLEPSSLCWISAAVPIITHSLPFLALSLMERAPLINFLWPTLRKSQQRKYELLAASLQQAGDSCVALASIAEDLANGHVRHGDGLANLTSIAARLSLDCRVVYAQAICACCPEVLIHILPSWLHAPLFSSLAAAALHDVSEAASQHGDQCWALRNGQQKPSILAC